MSESGILQVEAGDPNVDLLQLVSIAEALDIPLRTLLGRAEQTTGWGRASWRFSPPRDGGTSASGRRHRKGRKTLR